MGLLQFTKPSQTYLLLYLQIFRFQELNFGLKEIENVSKYFWNESVL